MNEGKELQGASHSPVFIYAELFLVVAIWAGTFVSTKIVLEEISPAVSALYRYCIASLLLLVIDYKNPERLKLSDYPLTVFLGATGITFYYLLQHYGINYTNATDAAVLISLSPVFIGIISWILLKEPLRGVTVLGLALAFVGCVLVITNGDLRFQDDKERLWGNILILLTAVSWALYSVYGKKLLNSYSIRTIVKYTTWFGTVLLVPFSLVEIWAAHGTLNLSLSLTGWLNLLYLGGLASVYGYLAWYRAMTRLPAVIVGSSLYFRPLLTGIIAAVVLQEMIGAFVLVGGILILAGTYLSTRQ